MLNFFGTRKLSRRLSKYLNPKGVQDLINGRALNPPRILSGPIEFVFVFVRADNPQQLSARLGLVADEGIEHGAVVHDLVGPMVVMAFGTLADAKHSPGSRANLVARLQQRFGGDAKIVHGAADGHFGNFGSEKRCGYTFTFPHFDAALAALSRLEFGGTEELL